MAGLSVVVTAGGTEEPIDPVRIITNRSTGKMGFAMARAAAERGAMVTLISSRGDGGVEQAKFIAMTTVESLRRAVLDACGNADLLVMAAAVSDFRPVETSDQKIKKSGRLTMEFEPVPDFTGEVPAEVFVVGFAAETEKLVEHGLRKYASHRFDLVCANDVTRPGAGFGTDTNEVVLIEPDGRTSELPLLPKLDIAHKIYDQALTLRRRSASVE